MKKMRQMHLWIGLITAILLFIEAGTGLLLTEKWLMGVKSSSHANQGQGHGEHGQSGEHLNIIDAIKKASDSGAFKMDQVSTVMTHGNYVVKLKDEAGTRVTIAPDGTVISKEANRLAAVVRDLHVGKIGTTDVTWMIDVAAISILLLTGTGIVLSLRTLRAQRKQKLKQLAKVKGAA